MFVFGHLLAFRFSVFVNCHLIFNISYLFPFLLFILMYLSSRSIKKCCHLCIVFSFIILAISGVFIKEAFQCAFHSAIAL